jgi:hypothetical protein
MFCRFVAACTVASVVIAGGAVMSLLLRFPVEGAWMLSTAWCFVPVAWGLWAMLAPSGWVPGRLPAWGAILGLAAGIVAGPLLNIPVRIGGPSSARWIALVAAPILYYLMWLLVGFAYRSLRVTDRSGTASSGD